MSSIDNSKLISAHEIGEYVYCSRSFWLKRNHPELKESAPKRTFLDLFRLQGNRLELEVKLHANRALRVKRQEETKRAAYILVLVSSILLILSITGYLVWRILSLSISFSLF